MEGIRRGSSSTHRPSWIDLPRDVTAEILRRLGPTEILESAQKVCTTWWRVSGEPSLWRVIHMKSSDEFKREDEAVFRRAVDRSRGELIDISIEQFGIDELLQYISDRSCNLNRLSLVRCYSVTAHGLTTALKNFPLLEELHLIETPLLCSVDIETISISCPKLKSFSFKTDDVNFMMKTNDRLAIAIAKSMPDLCCLSLFGNSLGNEGLKAILDGCPNLVSLDLRQCTCVDLKSEIGRRCSEQIKELRCPLDSTADCDWFDDHLSLDYSSNELDDDDYCHDQGFDDDFDYGNFQDYYSL